MTKDDIKKGLVKCTGVSCNGCPYNDNYSTCTDRLKTDARELIIKQEQEIEQLKAELKQLKTNAEILARGVRDLNHENYELTEKIKQAKIDVLNELKTKAFDKDAFNGWAGSTFVVLVRDIDKMIEELTK